MSPTEQLPDFLPEIRVGRIRTLEVHLISDNELSRLEQGSGQSLFLNLAIGVLSLAASFLISLLTTAITSDRLFTVFVIVTVVGFIGGIVLILLWWCTRIPISRLVQEIRDRMPPEGEAHQLPEPYTDTRENALPEAGDV